MIQLLHNLQFPFNVLLWLAGAASLFVWILCLQRMTVQNVHPVPALPLGRTSRPVSRVALTLAILYIGISVLLAVWMSVSLYLSGANRPDILNSPRLQKHLLEGLPSQFLISLGINVFIFILVWFSLLSHLHSWLKRNIRLESTSLLTDISDRDFISESNSNSLSPIEDSPELLSQNIPEDESDSPFPGEPSPEQYQHSEETGIENAIPENIRTTLEEDLASESEARLEAVSETADSEQMESISSSDEDPTFEELAKQVFKKIPHERSRTRFLCGLDITRLREDLFYGTMGAVAALLPAYLIILVLDKQYHIDIAEGQADLFSLMLERGTFLLLFTFMLLILVVAPFLEELLFRVTLQNAIQSGGERIGAVIIVAIIFCLSHEWPRAIALVPIALILGYLYLQRGRFATVVTTHVIYNGIMLLVTLLLVWSNGTDRRMKLSKPDKVDEKSSYRHIQDEHTRTLLKKYQ